VSIVAHISIVSIVAHISIVSIVSHISIVSIVAHISIVSIVAHISIVSIVAHISIVTFTKFSSDIHYWSTLFLRFICTAERNHTVVNATINVCHNTHYSCVVKVITLTTK